MCYSAQVWADYRQYVKRYQVKIDIKEFFDLFYRRRHGEKISVPKGLEASFGNPQTDEERAVKALIDETTAQQTAKFEEELFKQRKRLADAERTHQTKPTKAATESQRIAGNKVEWVKGKLADLHRTTIEVRDSRIFPGHYAPVMVMEEGELVVKPMRYQCRPAGKPAFYDTKYPGTYNARRDNLKGFWKDLYGFSHGVMVVNAFYENVNRHRTEGRELAEGEPVENVVLEFRPRPAQEMLVACLWSHWKGSGDEPDLLSFSAITDEPPPEVAAAGHDRCIIPLRPENLEAWLNPSKMSIDQLEAMLDDRATPYYEHLLLAA